MYRKKNGGSSECRLLWVSILPLSAIFRLDFGTVLTVCYFGTVQTVWYFFLILLATEQNITFLYIIVLDVLNRIMISDIENEVKKEHKMKQNELLGECSHRVFLHRR